MPYGKRRARTTAEPTAGVAARRPRTRWRSPGAAICGCCARRSPERGLRETWLPALVCGFAFAAAQFTASDYVSAQLADIAAVLVGAAALMAVPGARRPAEEPVCTAVLTSVRSEDLDREDPHREVLRAYAPYALIVAVFSVARIPPAKELLTEATRVSNRPLLDVANPAGKPVGANLFTLPVIATGGTLVLLAGLVTTVVLRVRPRAAAREWAGTVYELRYAILTVTSVLALAYVMNLSGQAATIGQFVAAAGAGPAFLSPVLGRFGVAVSRLRHLRERPLRRTPGLGGRRISSLTGAAGRGEQLRRGARQDDLSAEPDDRVRGGRPGRTRGGPAAQGAAVEPGTAVRDVPDRAGTEHDGAGPDASLSGTALDPARQ
ncbi:L-lactate permease [Streptomyces sp. Ncost-T10-10d]|nr:L-lactate permease [Streptomyces sp. Ncost-T10-10d]